MKYVYGAFVSLAVVMFLLNDSYVMKTFYLLMAGVNGYDLYKEIKGV